MRAFAVRFAAFVLLAWLIGFVWFAVALPKPADNRETDSIVVLTGGAGRIDRALELMEAKTAKRLLISGVDRDVKPAELAEEYGRSVELFDCCIDLGFQAVDTRSNALETARWVAKREHASVRLITSDWHMRRARLEIERALPPDVLLVTDAVTTRPSMRALLTEYNKFATRWLVSLVGI